MTTVAAAAPVVEESPDMSTTPTIQSPTLLREWSYPTPTEPPVAPAIVLNEEEGENDDAAATGVTVPARQVSQGYTYPVATFVSNLVRSSVGHIYPVGEDGSDSNLAAAHGSAEQVVPVTSIRSEPVTTSVDNTTMRSFVSESYGEGDFDDAEFVLIDGDLVAVPSPPMNPEELEAMELAKKACKTKHMKRFGRWIRKRASRRASPRNGEETIMYETPPPVQGKRKNKRNKKRRRRRINTSGEEEFADMLHQQHIVEEVPVVAHEYTITSPPTAEAHLIGNADQLLEAGLLPACTSAEAYIELDDKVDELTWGPPEKVDKIDSYLTTGAVQLQEEDEEDSTDLDSSVATIASDPVEGPQRAPLSKACSSDEDVYNDTLKVMMVGAPHTGKSTLARALRKGSCNKKRRRSTLLGVDVNSWTTKTVEHGDDGKAVKKQLRISIWDVNDKASAGMHPATQSIFFSENSLYVVVWDMAGGNQLAQRRILEDESEDEDDLADEFLLERLNRQADGALEVDIHDRVLCWVDQIAATTNNAVILPVATVPEGMDEYEAQRRCSMMQAILMDHVQALRNPPKLANDSAVLRIDMKEGVEELKDAILDIATSGRDQEVFGHVGCSVPPATVEVLEAVRNLRSDNHKVVLVDHLVAEGVTSSTSEIVESLAFLSSIGEVLYFGNNDENDLLTNYVVLCRKWLVSALSCILCDDLKNELIETRNFMNMQCEYSGQRYSDSDVTRTLLGGSNSNCPVLSSNDASMLWQSMNFMREAADKSANVSSTRSPENVFGFLKRLLVHSGVFVPLTMPTQRVSSSEEVFLVPGMLPQTEPHNVWTYRSSQSWMTTLCHSWLLREGAPPNMMERITVSLLEDLYAFSQNSAQARPKACRRSLTYPMDRDLQPRILEDDEEQVVGRIKIHQIMCWKSSLIVNIGCFFEDPESGQIRESVVEVFVSLADQQSHHCVASSSMGSGVKKLIVSGKGQSGHDGRKLWKGGYGLVLDSIKASVAFLAGNIERQIACPECLAESHHTEATSWSWDCVRSAVECGNPNIRCIRGHLADANMLCGACRTAPPTHRQQVGMPPCVSTPVSSLLGGVVVVGLWDGQSKKIRNVGSGFVADSKQGLIVTAAHVLFDMSEDGEFGCPYFGLQDAKAVIGVIPKGEETAVFRYFADIVSHDVHSMDACVLRIVSRFENDVGGEGEGCANEREIPIRTGAEVVKRESLQQLKMTRRCELEEKVRIVGFNQGGEGILEKGKHVNRCVDFAKGYVCKKFKAVLDDIPDATFTSSEPVKVAANRCFTPREEIVVICPTISGHSGGPCVNEEGKVIGILSRADPTDRHRCYLVPTSELKKIVKLAKTPMRR